jgi:preprotein translocase subunit SecD
MTEPTTAPPAGCLGWLLALLMLPFSLFVAGSFQASSVTTLPDASILRITLEAADPAVLIDLQPAADVLTRRLTTLGLSEAVVAVDESRMIVEVAANQVEDAAALAETLTTTGLLEFVDFTGLAGEQFVALDNARIQTTGQAEAGIIFEGALKHPVTGEAFQTVLTGAMLADSTANMDQMGQWQLAVVFTPSGSEIMQAYTASHIGEPLAIVLDGVVRSAPYIQQAISTEAVIQGSLEETEARNLAALLASGALPVRLVVVTIEVIE